MTGSPKFIERPADLSVTHEEGQGMWAQIDAGRIGLHNVMERLDSVERRLGTVAIGVFVGVVAMVIPSALSVWVLIRVLDVLSRDDARALIMAAMR